MHIKQIIISGFRSFRNQNEIEPFSSKHNVIVGRNGSGKSNFFDAIQFVLLSPKFANLRQEDRQYLLHEGAGSSVMAAYVEIIFDNSDGRLSVESDEVVLRRTIGHKKDEFFLNRKRIQKSEVLSLLESAGFSKSNPYYIVQQGKVANLCVMKDKDRLNLLKEVAGTTVYEERRRESLKIMQETASKQEQIQEVLSFIDERLSELDKEQEELKEYESLDKNRRALEYSLYDKELSKAKHQLEEMDIARFQRRIAQDSLYAQLRDVQDKVQQGDEELVAARQAVERLTSRKNTKASELAGATRARSSIEAALQEAEAAAKSQAQESTRLRAKLEEVVRQLTAVERDLSGVEPAYESKAASVLRLRQEIASVKSRTELIYGKQGRSRQFSTIAQRNSFLLEQIQLLEGVLGSKKELKRRLQQETSKEEGLSKKEESHLRKMEEEKTNKTSSVDAIGKDIGRVAQKRNELQEQRKMAWKQMEELLEDVVEAKRDRDRGKQALSSSLPRHISDALACLESVAADGAVPGYYGAVIDNFTLKNENFKTAVEVAAGNSLFHVVVDTDKTAAFLMKELERRKAGRLTFLPLNRLRVEAVTYPDSSDARPLIDVAIEFDPMFEQAMRQVFSKKLIVRDLEVAAQVSRQYSLDCITREGDLVGRKGGFEGGFRDDRISKISAMHKTRDATRRLVELSGREDVLKKSSEELDTAMSETVRELQRLETEREHVREISKQLNRELEARQKQLTASQATAKGRKKALDEVVGEIELSEGQIEEYRREMETPLVSNLSAEERNELCELEASERRLQTVIASEEADLLQVSTRREALRADLDNNLKKRKLELEGQLILIGSGGDEMTTTGGSNVDLQDIRQQQSSSQRQIKSFESELDTVEKLLEGKVSEVVQLEKLSDQLHQEEVRVEQALQEENNLQDKVLNKQIMLQTTVQQKSRAILELCTLPRKELDSCKALVEKQVLKRLREVNDQLKKYASVNRKALDQYVSFSEQRQQLLQRKDELTVDGKAIQDLVSSLDQQKEEAILRTFRSVSSSFTEVFADLVPGGHGELVMRTAADESQGDVEGEERDADLGVNKPNIDTGTGGVSGDGDGVEEGKGSPTGGRGQGTVMVNALRGVQVRVSFSGTGQQLEMQQLSGGQKALVALTLIFSIQRCDPAPFYLFDEIDQALDANYRAGVARLIQKQVHSVDAPAQFITTTFRPELVSVAHKCFGIALQNKVSNIYPLDKSDAERFVVNLMNEEEAVGHVTTVPSYSRALRNKDNEGEADGEDGDDDGREERKEITDFGDRTGQRMDSDDENRDENYQEEEEDEDEDYGEEGDVYEYGGDVVLKSSSAKKSSHRAAITSPSRQTKKTSSSLSSSADKRGAQAQRHR
eukprot:gene1154-2235_t